MSEYKGILEIIQLGNPILRKRARVVKNIQDLKIQKLIDDLMAVVMEVNGIGLAAPQVSRPWRIFILASHPNPRYPKAPKIKPKVIINPKIIYRSRQVSSDWEGCLSIPGIRGAVSRSKSIKVTYTTRRGDLKREKYNDFLARTFQHEYDHLEGKVFLDRVSCTKDIITEKEYQKMVTKKDNHPKT